MHKTYVKIIYDVDGWAYHNRALALQKHAPDDMDIYIGKDLGEYRYDVVLLLEYQRVVDIRDQLNMRSHVTKLITSFNNGLGYETQLLTDVVIPHSHHVLVLNEEMWSEHAQPDMTCIANDVDLDIFRPTRPITERPRRVLWTGSTFSTERKGLHEMARPVRQLLTKHGVQLETHVVDPFGNQTRTPEQMCAWYNDGQVHLITASTEGGPNTALEAAACGLPVVSTKVGHMPQLLNGVAEQYLVDRDVPVITSAILRALEDLESASKMMLEKVQYWDWKLIAPSYYHLFRRVLCE